MYILMPYVCPLGITPSIGLLPPHFFPQSAKKIWDLSVDIP